MRWRAPPNASSTHGGPGLAVRAHPGADFIEQRHRSLFEQAGADAAEHIIGVWRSRMTLSIPPA